MNTKALRQKVLDLAIHGKLLSPEIVAELKKSPEYETADVLLEKIRKEKEEKISKGELKADKKDSYIFIGDDKRHYEKFADGTVKDIEDEIPFEVPEGWAWCRLSMLVSELGDGIHGTPNYNDEGKYYFVNGNNIVNGKIEIKAETKKVDDSEYLKYKKTLSQNTVFVSINGTLGNVAFYNNEPIILGKSACYFNLLITELKQYCYYFLISDYFKKYAEENATGSTIKNVSLQTMRSLLIPLPPLNEQIEIVSAIEKVFQQIEYLDKNKSDLQTAVKQAKSKILDLAIHGNLIPQSPNDEPASVLLEKLRAEKEERIAKGELKRDKNDSYIYKGSDNCYYEKFASGKEVCIEDEIPFEVPDSWSWCRLGKIGIWKSGTTPNKKNIDYYKDGTIPWLLTGDLNNCIITDIPNRITEKALKETSLKLNPANSVCIAMYGATIGKLGILSIPATTNQACCVCSDFQGIYNKYLFYFLMQHKEKFILQGFGGAQPNISKEKIVSTLIPLPPINEQKRIVSKIEEIFGQLDQIQNNII
ncbi:restriction endonuclease subunit S [Treponema sp.]|uniref:restriction endonuclease subunit S n=1 Tax=Treponema sp. TaxID=166 RepID=UPI003F0DBB6F